MKSIIVCLVVCFSLMTSENIKAQDELDVIKNSWMEYSDVQNSLYHLLATQSYSLLDKRTGVISSLKTLKDWQIYQRNTQKTLNDIAGPFPDKTPLKARVLGTVKKEYFKVENIVFESRPGFFVTSSLFIPAGLKEGSKAPAILYCSGHSADGYRSTVYQHVILNLVKKGFIVFAFDPVGQGERLEYLDPVTGKSRFNSPTIEHSYPGAQLFITGTSVASYMIWDGIRAIDYLLTRSDVDPARIGITGRSGGGTQTAYIAAIDERIYASAPENYITNFTRLIQSIGPQDAEQNLMHEIRSGIDHPDFLIVRAPKPTLMITTSGDMFNIQGAIETEKEVARIYKAYGKEKNFYRVEDDAPHASTKKNREAMYHFFQEQLNNPGNTYDEDVDPLTSEELRVTQTGQVATSFTGGETLFSLNRIEADKLSGDRRSSNNNGTVKNAGLISSAQMLSGYREPSEISDPVLCGRIRKEGYVIEKYYVKGEGDYPIPYLVFKPDQINSKYLLYLHPAGKSAEALPGGEIEFFVKKGFIVFAPDLIGLGETGPVSFRGDANIEGISHNIWYASLQIGRSITGIRAGDVVRLEEIIKRTDGKAEIYALARKEMAPVLLHAAAFKSSILHIALIAPYSSFRSIVMNRFYRSLFIPGAVPDALQAYDLPDLAASLAPRKLLIAGATDGNGEFIDIAGIERDMAIIRSGYKRMDADPQLSIISGDLSGRLNDIFMDWIK